MTVAAPDRLEAKTESARTRMPHWLPLAFTATAVVTYAYALGMPRLEEARELRAEIAALRIESAGQSAAAADGPQPSEEQSTSAERPLTRDFASADLLPAVSGLGRQTGVQISSVKRASSDREAVASSVHVRAKADFAEIVSLLENIGGFSPLLVVDEIDIRRQGANSGHHRLAVELVVAMTKTEGGK